MARKQEDVSFYNKRLDRVLSYMHEHLDQNMSIEDLADVACMSPFHWHRTFKRLKGETISDTLKKMRMQRATFLLKNSNLKVRCISQLSGYESHRSFSRAFHASFGQTPRDYRKAADTPLIWEKECKNLWPVSIVEIPERRGIMMDHEGGDDTIGETLALLIAKSTGGKPQNDNDEKVSPRCFGLHHSAEKMLAFIELEADRPHQDFPPALRHAKIEGGFFATINYRGPLSGISAIHHWFFSYWLPQSAYIRSKTFWYEAYKAPLNKCKEQFVEAALYFPVGAQRYN